jgi:hypothetical protein
MSRIELTLNGEARAVEAHEGATTAPAVANALYRFDGVRRTALPTKGSPAARFISGKK